MRSIPFIALFIISIHIHAQQSQTDETSYLYLMRDSSDNNKCGYVNALGDTIVPLGKYAICFTDTIKHFGVVLMSGGSFVAIDQNDNTLFEVFPFDNGPDEPSEGLFRIVNQGKIGYANTDGRIVIEPKYQCADPFNNGCARVSTDCDKLKDGEYTLWNSKSWIFIDTLGQKMTDKPSFNCPSYYDKALDKVVYNLAERVPDVALLFLTEVIQNLNTVDIPEDANTFGLISVVVDIDGSVSSIKFANTITENIDMQISELVKQWKLLHVGYCNGNAVPYEVKIPYHLEFEGEKK